jgi:hypothetical protein
MGFILKKIEPLTRAAADRNRKLAIRRDFYCDSLFIRYNARRVAATCGKPKPKPARAGRERKADGSDTTAKGSSRFSGRFCGAQWLLAFF